MGVADLEVVADADLDRNRLGGSDRRKALPAKPVGYCCSLMQIVLYVLTGRHPYSIPCNSSHLPVHCILYTFLCDPVFTGSYDSSFNYFVRMHVGLA